MADRTISSGSGTAAAMKPQRSSRAAESAAVAFEEYDAAGAARAQYLMAQLSVVDRAIEKVIHNPTDAVSDSAVAVATTTVTTAPGPSRLLALSAPQQQQQQRSGNAAQIVADRSFKIDTTSKQLATCQLCLEELDVRLLKSHVANACPNKLVRCPEPNCRSAQMPQRDLRRHLATECEVARHRRELLADAKRRKAEEKERQQQQRELLLLLERERQKELAAATAAAAVNSGAGDAAMTVVAAVEEDLIECPQCAEPMRESLLSLHLRSDCPRRLAMCPNFFTGCQQRLVPLQQMQQHLRNECAAERLRERMIAKSAQRRERVQCPACGLLVPLLQLRRHERELCRNRLVPCRNHALGCRVMVRRGERRLHEFVDGSRQQRTALYMNSHSAHLSLREDDVACPWTAEYWIYRPAAEESAKKHIISALLLLPKYAAAFVAESCVKNRVLQIVNHLKNAKAAKDSNSSDSSVDKSEQQLAKQQQQQKEQQLSSAERALQKRAEAEARLSLVNELTQLVAVYSSTVLHYLRAFQAIAIAVEAGAASVEEINAVQTHDEHISSSLQQLLPGELAKQPEIDFSFAAQTRRPHSSSNSSGDAAADGHGGDMMMTAVDAASISIGGLDTAVVAAASDDNDKATVALAEADTAAETDAAVVHTSGGGGSDDDNNSNNSKEDSDNDDDLNSDERLLADIDKQIAEQSAIIGRWEQQQQSQRPASTGVAVDVISVAAYLHGGNAFAHLLRECLRLHDLPLLQRVDQLQTNTAAATANYTTADAAIESAAAATAAFGGHSSSSSRIPAHERAVEHPFLFSVAAAVDDVDADTDVDLLRHERLVQLQQRGISQFLVDVLVNPARAIRRHSMNWQSWKLLLQLLQTALKRDFDWLQHWRIIAGLLKPEAHRSRKKDAADGLKSLTAEQEKALEKKEKMRKRRELKKQQSKSLQTAADAPTATSSSSNSNRKSIQSPQQEEKLINRIAEALKAGCGGGIIAESSSCTAQQNRSKICLEMWSGLSVLSDSTADAIIDGDVGDDVAVAVDAAAEQQPHYELLLRERDFAHMSRMAGKFGVVCTITSPPTADTATTSATTATAIDDAADVDAEVDDSGPESTAASAATRALKLGTEVRCFDLKIPRCRWTHIALVAAAEPQNRLTLYVDGLMIKQMKDCAFPLPMNSLGGSCQSQGSFESFEGALLDVRYWRARRSGIEVQDFMHRLPELPEQPLASAVLADKLLSSSSTRAKQRDSNSNSSGSNNNGCSGADLIGWWTFEDGASSGRVADVTGHRFKAPIEVRSAPSPSLLLSSPGQQQQQSQQLQTQQQQVAEGTTECRVAYCVEDDSKCYAVPSEVRRLMPHTFRRLLPAAAAAAAGDDFAERATADSEGSSGADSSDNDERPSSPIAATTVATTAATRRRSSEQRRRRRVLAPWENLLRELSQSSWLDAESIVTGVRRFTHPQQQKIPPPDVKRPKKRLPPHLAAAATATAATRKATSASAAAEEAVEVLPLPSFKMRSLCPFELRRHRLALKGRALQRLVDCPLGCGQKIRVLDVRFHVRYECIERVVACRFSHCSASFAESQRELHERDDCQVLKDRAELLLQVENHSAIYVCASCSEMVKLRDQERHDAQQCPHRLLWCTHDDCSRGRNGSKKLQLLQLRPSENAADTQDVAATVSQNQIEVTTSVGASDSDAEIKFVLAQTMLPAGPNIPAHRLEFHLSHECDSSEVQNKFLLIHRARLRSNYPRPWGITIPILSVSKDKDSHGVEVVADANVSKTTLVDSDNSASSSDLVTPREENR